MWRRIKAKWWLFTHTTDSYARRTQVENYLRDAARGKEPLPDAEKCRELALTLGIPTDCRVGKA